MSAKELKELADAFALKFVEEYGFNEEECEKLALEIAVLAHRHLMEHCNKAIKAVEEGQS